MRRTLWERGYPYARKRALPGFISAGETAETAKSENTFITEEMEDT